jgi:hypothetical protein
MKGSIKLLGIALLAATASQVCGADFDTWIAKGVRPGMTTQQVYALTGEAIKGSQMARFEAVYKSHLATKKATAVGDEAALISQALGEAGVDADAATRGRAALLARLQAQTEAAKLKAGVASKAAAASATKAPAQALEEGLVASGIEATAAKFLATTFMTAGADDFCPEVATISKDDNMATAAVFGSVADELKDVIADLEPKDGTHFLNFGLVGLAIQDVLKDAPDLLTALTKKGNAGLFNFAGVSAHLASADDLATVLKDLVVAQYNIHRAGVEAIRANATPFGVSGDWSGGFDAAEDIAAPVLAALDKSATWVALKKVMS